MAFRQPFGLCGLVLIAFVGVLPGLRATPPPLLARAFTQWDASRDDLAFTQQTRFLAPDGSVKEERTERYDPSQPDRARWRLLEVDGQPPTEAQRKKWEGRKNAKPRKKVAKSPSGYVDLNDALLLGETDREARFEVRLRQDVARLLGVESLAALITVDKETGSIVHITSTLREPLRVLMGLARITDLDVDVHFEPLAEASALETGAVETGSTARVTISRLGTPVEYSWSDFKRVKSFRAPPS